MLPRDHGVIVQVGSTRAYRAIPIQAAYCAAKHALRGFTDSLRTELRHDRSRVRVTMVHLPALDTPQFDWVLTRLPGRARPIGPMFAPELAAEAILWAAGHERRELPVTASVPSGPTSSCLVYWNRYLARTAYDGQHEGHRCGRAPANLWAPVPGDYGAHGRFGDRARTFSLQYWVTTHRLAVMAALTGTAAAMLLARPRVGRLPTREPGR